jgi:hypothetical protein
MTAPLSEPATWTRRHTQAFAVTVVVLALFPWTVLHWPTQDGQNHLAVAHVLTHYADAGSPFPQYVSMQTGFRPSAALYEILCFAGRFMPLQAAEKCVVSVAAVMLALSALLFVWRAVPGRIVNAMLALPFVIAWAFAMGFLNFQLGMAIGVVSLALGWEPQRAGVPTPRLHWRHGLASVAYFLCVWCHPVAALITGLGLLVLEWRSVLRPSEWARMLVTVGPGAAFLVGAYLAAPPVAQTTAAPLETGFADPVTVVGAAFEYNIGWTPWELGPRLVALGILVPGAYRAMRASRLGGSSPEAAVARVVLTMVVLYCVTPGVFRGWFYSSTRFFLFALLLLPAAAEIPARVERRLVWLAPALTAATLVIQWPSVHRFSAKMQDILDAAASLPRGAKVVPMDFTVTVLGPEPLGHAWAQLVVEHDAVASQLFAAGKPRMGGERFRTLTFRPGLLDISAGQLPWSTYETWNDVTRMCASPWNPTRWFVHLPGDCKSRLAERKETLEAVIDRYDYVLMIDPPDYGRALIAPHLKLVRQVGAAWMYAVVPSSAPREIAQPAEEQPPSSGAHASTN